jgi:hypothetical protein
MAYMLGPDSFGLPSPASPLGQTVVKALLAKHGVSAAQTAAPANAAPKTAPVVSDVMPKPDLGAEAPVSIAGGDSPLSAGQPVDLSSVGNGGMKAPGFLDRIGDFLKSDDGRATMMRFAAGAFNGGIGGGLGYATHFADQRRHEHAAAAEAATQDAFKTRELDDNREWHLGQLDNQAALTNETIRHNQAGELNDDYRTTSENWRAGVHESGETHRTGMVQSGEDRRTAANLGEKRFEHVNPSGDTTYTQDQTTFREQHPVATPAPVHPNTLSTHVHYTTTPEEYARNGPRLRPSQVQPADATVQQISSDAEYGSLPSGTRFRGPDGQVRVKP